MPNLVATGQITINDLTDAVSLVLSNNAHLLPARSDGTVLDFTGASSTAAVRLGTSDVSSQWTFVATPSTGVTGTNTGQSFTVTGMTVDSGYVDFVASKAGIASLTARFSLVKVKQGIPAFGNQLFDDGRAGWATSSANAASGIEASASDWTFNTSYATRSNVLITATNARKDLYSIYRFSIDPTRTYKIKCAFRILAGSAPDIRMYVGIQQFNASGATLGAGSGMRYACVNGLTYPQGTGWVDVTSAAITGTGTGTLQFESGCTYVRLFALVNFDENTTISVGIDELSLLDVTESTLASSWASAASTSATNAATSATNSGTSATASQTSRLAAEVALASTQAALNRIIPDRVSRKLDHSPNYNTTYANPEAIPVMTIGTVVAVANEGDVLQYDSNTRLITRGWIPVSSGKTFTANARLALTLDGSGGAADIALGFAAYDAAGAYLGEVQYSVVDSTWTTAEGWRTFEKTTTSAEIINLYNTAAYVRPLLRLYNITAVTTQYQIASLGIRDTTDIALATAQAVISTNQAVTATNQASAASTSATVAASVGSRSLIKNPNFSNYPTTTGIPPSWADWTAGSGTRVTGETGVYGYQLVGAANTSGGIKQSGIAGGIVPNAWFVIEAHVKLDAGTFAGAGVLLRALTSGGATAQDLGLAFSTDKDSTGAVIGAGTVGKIYRFAKLVQVTAGTADQVQVFVANHLNTFGSIAVANTITWYMASVRPASDQEILNRTAAADIGTLSSSVSTVSSAVTDINSRMSATWSVTVNAGNRFAGIKLQTEGGPGTVISTFDIDADYFRVWNGTASVPTFAVSGGNAYINGNLVRTESMLTEAATKFSSQIDTNGFGGFGSRTIGWNSNQTETNATTVAEIFYTPTGFGKTTVQWNGCVQWAVNAGRSIKIWLQVTRHNGEVNESTSTAQYITIYGNGNSQTGFPCLTTVIDTAGDTDQMYIAVRMISSDNDANKPVLSNGAAFLLWEGKR